MRPARRLLALVALLAATPAAEYPARVAGVSDGDTLTVLAAVNVRCRIRLWGVDAPETSQDSYQ
jgi:endonuclease YncB( thermonuclease family)